MKEIISLFVVYVLVLGGFFTSVIHDAMHSLIVWVIVDILVSPVGIVRGWLIWLGLAG